MASTIKIKNSSTAGAVPGSGDLVQGELAVNVTDKKIYTKNASGTVVNLGTTPSITDNGNATAITIDSSENVGIGVSPSGWASGTKALDVGSGSALFNPGSSTLTWLMSNAYNNGTNFIYKNTGAAGYYSVGTAHSWHTAASGTKDNSISFTQAMTLDASGNLLLGTTSKLSPNSGAAEISIQNALSSELILNCTKTGGIKWDINSGSSGSAGGGFLSFYDLTSSATRMQIDSSGRLLVGVTSTVVNESSLGVSSAGNTATFKTTGGTGNSAILVWNSGTSGTRGLIQFSAGSSYSAIGSIESNGTSTSYNTSSDYRLKENIQPMTDALSVVSQLKPVTYTWKTDGSNGQGFIAHELQAVVPDCVTGEKDAVDAEGNPQYQGIDTSFLVATLTAALQEQQAIIESLTARITALEA